jgi:hypothetical protein
MTMHPRMEYPRERRRVLNTCAAPKPPCKKLDRKRARLNARQTAWHATVNDPRNRINPNAFRMPGSMK